MMTQRADCNCGVGQPQTPCSNTNSLHPLQCNGDVPSDVQEFVGDPSTSVEALEATCGDGSYKIFTNILQKLVFYLNIYKQSYSKHCNTLKLSLYK